MPSETFQQSAHLTLEPSFSRWGNADEPNGFKIARVTQKRPTNLENGAVAVRVTIQIPKAAFEPLRPAALVIVPEELVQHEVDVEATDS